MASVFRKTAMERLASPDRLDCMLKITSPLSWIGIIVSILTVGLVIAWSFLGKIPSTVSTTGFIVNSYNTNTLFSPMSGRVSKIYVNVGDEIVKGDDIYSICDIKGVEKTVVSEQAGVVSEILIENNMEVTPNIEMIRLSPNTSNNLSLVCYVNLDIAKQLQEGMETKVYLNSYDANEYGYMRAKITNIDSYISSSRALNEILGEDGQMAGVLTMNGPVVAVTCELVSDTNNASGYYFSSEKSENITISSGEQANAQFITKEVAPISKVFPKFGGNE